MSHRTELERHRSKLGEIRDIMGSMKILAYMETRKLSRFIESQHRLVDDIQAMAGDFLQFYPAVLPTIETTVNIILVTGSQRGFCGDFNERLVSQLQPALVEHKIDDAILIAVGQKLHILLEKLPYKLLYVDGTNIAEEASNTVEQIAQTLSSNKNTLLSFYAFHHSADENNIIFEKLLPPSFPPATEDNNTFKNPPLLNLEPEVFFLKLIDQYLFSILHRIVFSSLLAENQLRIQHLERAVNHLDEKMNQLILKGNALRQEEIIEEIEVILLNTSAAKF